jgi:hypothetical protein
MPMPGLILLRTALAFVLVANLYACAATTLHYGIPAPQLTDEQLIEEIGSALHGVGVEFNRTMFLLAVRPEPAYVLTSSTTSFSGSANATVNAYSMPVGYGVATHGQVRGTVTGASTTQYRYTDVNAAARLGNVLAVAISQSRQEAYRKRGLEVWEEYERRVAERRHQTEQLIATFFQRNPDLEQRRLLVAAIAPWAAAEGAEDGAATLEQTKRIIDGLSRDGRGATGLWHGTISQVTRLDDGETIAFSQFARLELVEADDGRVTGAGTLGTGEVIEFDGRISGQRLDAAVANTTSAINVTLTGIVTPSQITAEYEGYGAGQRLTGTAVLLR